MRLVIEGDIPEGHYIRVTCYGQTYILNSFDKQAIYTITEMSDVTVIIEEMPSKCNYSFVQILVFLLTSLIRGIFNAILINVDNGWYKHVVAYSTRATFRLRMKEDIHIQFKISESIFTGTIPIWQPPRLKIEPNIIPDIVFTKNLQGVSNAFASYLKNIVSIAMACMALFGILSIVAISHNIYDALIATVGLLIGIIVLLLWKIRKEYLNYKNFLISFRDD